MPKRKATTRTYMIMDIREDLDARLTIREIAAKRGLTTTEVARYRRGIKRGAVLVPEGSIFHMPKARYRALNRTDAGNAKFYFGRNPPKSIGEAVEYIRKEFQLELPYNTVKGYLKRWGVPIPTPTRGRGAPPSLARRNAALRGDLEVLIAQYPDAVPTPLLKEILNG